MPKRAKWTFLTSHAHVLRCLLQTPDSTLPQVAASVGLTQRAVQTITNDLVAAGYLERIRLGRRNRYTFRLQEFSPELEEFVTLHGVIALLLDRSSTQIPSNLSRIAEQTRATLGRSHSALEEGRQVLKILSKHSSDV